MSERDLLQEYVAAGKLMQVATIAADSTPRVCSVWYAVESDSSRLWFLSRTTREHSANLRERPAVAGAIVAIPLTGIGQTVRGVQFTGRARELAADDETARMVVGNWPEVRAALDLAGPSRLYEIAVTEWVLFDEEHYPDDPRRTISG
ncbi:pyridoxamine 5'-phosphate oxidase family protein [Nocardia sp. BMG111209]|uniref:pyridoxamine 5'-phosphate oxidase family protein n=1 Tax=Nocardia sp. BMG111209 TaxID=1160137 RepID=UPI0003A278E0|nr:pyridoxamine 5'-phosphate oxidase family protein [Nocardia sp. BMG111209]